MIPTIFSDRTAPQVKVTLTVPSKTYRVVGNRIIGMVDGYDALEQSISHRLSTERFAYGIYGWAYGTMLQQYVGASLDYIRATIENTLQNSLMQDLRISSVRVTEVEQTDVDSCVISFNIHHYMGSPIETRLTINV